MGYVTAFGVANPPHRVSQSGLADFMVKVMQLNPKEERKLRAVFRSSGIDYRYSVLGDYTKLSDFTFFPNNHGLESLPSTGERMEQFRRHAARLSIQAVRNAFGDKYRGRDISHLITVCCTGMYAPGLDYEIIKECGLPQTMHRIALNFMGCYAAISALRTAEAFCQADRNARVLIVCTELCSLHFQQEFNEDNLLANGLFGDGSAALIMESAASSWPAFRLRGFRSVLLPDGERDMAWNVGNRGFEMKLTSYVPELIGDGIRQLAMACLAQTGLRMEDISYFAIHPGGKRILEMVEKQLGIQRDSNRFSHEILRCFGNMSSPTVLFVLRRIYENLSSSDHGKYVLSFAFGPGLTMESMMLQIENHRS